MKVSFITSIALSLVACRTNAVVTSPDDDVAQAFDALIHTLRGTDDRLFPWDVTDETRTQQETICPQALPDAIDVLVAPIVATTDNLSRRTSLNVKSLAATLAALCLTDRPAHRVIVASSPHAATLYLSVVDMLSASYDTTQSVIEDEDKEATDAAGAAAAHLIWIAVYGNAAHHAGFVNAGAVAALSRIVVTAHKIDVERSGESEPEMTPQTLILPSTIMWAAAALQNLAASYCDGAAGITADNATSENAKQADDPICHWKWHLDDATHLYTLNIDVATSGPQFIDGAPVRRSMLEIDNLVTSLLEWTCKGPVTGETSLWNPFPGENAVVKVQESTRATNEVSEEDMPARHETSFNLIPWSTAGALKNLVLDATARAVVDPDVTCFCWMRQSPDWLEANKGEGLLQHLRPADPCNFNEHERDEEDEEHEHDEEHEEERKIATFYLCVDTTHFLDASHKSCEDMALSPELCDASTDVSTGVSASTACCSCGGGHVDNDSRNSMRAAGQDEDEEEDGFEEEL